MSRYVLAVKRDQRAAAPADWLDQAREINGLQVMDSIGPYALVEASDRAVTELSQKLGQFLHVERETFYHLASDAPDPQELQATVDLLRRYHPTPEQREQEIAELAKAEVENSDPAEGRMVERHASPQVAAAKLTTAAAKSLVAAGGQPVTLIVELSADDNAKTINERKAAFDRDAAEVREIVERCGGTYVDGAWISRTIRVKVTALQACDVLPLPGVAKVDRARQLQME